MPYTIEKHRLEFSIWAACRAAQAGWAQADRPEFSSALRNCGIIEFLNCKANDSCSREEFEKDHAVWIQCIRNYIHREHQKKITVGVAAKLIAVFLKGYYILAGNQDTNLARIAHPPIDSYLLEGIDENKGTDLSKRYTWQSLTEDTYRQLISELREICGDCPFWELEKYWELDKR